MKRLVAAIAVTVVLVPSFGTAQDFDKGLAAYEAGNYEAALEEWTPLAEQGEARAQNNLGFMYDKGEGVPQDYAQARRWYRLAAEQGDAGAQVNIGWIYANGLGVPQDYVLAHMWFNLSSANGASRQPRDELAGTMTPAAVEEAQRRARVCWTSNYADCD